MRSKIPTFKPANEDLSYLFADEVFEKYESIEKIGEASINGDDLIVIASKTSDPLTEKSGKKKQYEIAKKILKEEVKDASLFVFYDDDGNFRFSFVNANYLGTKRTYTDFKRYTYFVNKDKLNKTFKSQVGDCSFSSLDEIINAFSVEPLNKQFYQEISKAFYKLIGGKIKIGSKKLDFKPLIELPSTSITSRKVFQEFGVRLIGRTIFCWFLKNKKSPNKKPLIPENWLQSNTVELLSNGGYNYYHDYLEKLFFLILNKKQDERGDYDLPDGHETIPFLNGGLFEAHSDDFFPKDSNGIHKVSYNLKIPNNWFFELFKVLEQFNFTIDENSINDAEVSIDPEMLGTIFENLLAEIDPDTEKSARKATGSFYTPREIVDYMVEQSIIQYLKTKTSVEDEEPLQKLFKEGGENEFNTAQTEEILEALNTVKILDPACGSGAFPMGALHKIITILHKLDPDASWWKEKQVAKIDNAILRKQFEEKLNKSTNDYARKLGIIQHSIYGVDIQPIATEIAKLRSFLSLIIDENIDDNAPNRGIEPLPNLEFKFVTANTLIGLPDESGQQGMFDNFEELNQLEQLRADYLQSSGIKKNKIKKRFLKVQKKAFANQNNLFADPNSRAFKIISWNPFKDEASTWFDPEWMYGVEKFDIVIGNPPYVFTRDVNFGIGFKDYINKEYFSGISLPKKSKSRQAGKINLFAVFLLRGKKLISNTGSLIYIIPNNILRGTIYDVIRFDLLKRNKIISIVDLGEGVFNKVTASTILLQIGNKLSSDSKTNVITDVKSLQNKDFQHKEISQEVFLNNTSFTFNIMLNDKELELSNKLKYNKVELGEFCIDIIAGIAASKDLIFENTDNNTYELFEGKDVKRFHFENVKNHILWDIDNIARTRPDYLWEEPKKIVTQRISGGKMPLVVALDKNKRRTFNSTNNIVLKKEYQDYYEFMTCLLNSKLINWFYANNFSNNSNLTVNISKTFLETLPTKLVEKNELSVFNELHSNLENTYGTDEFIDIYENLNILIYKLYELNYNEVLLIDPKFKLTKEQYKNYQIE
ncbi:MAG: N-6 DNA methylase [Lutibacter sp.]|nr:N-6 DNA methylase [Lutibacter sp.]